MAETAIRRMVATVVAAMPAKEIILRVAGVLPPVLRNRLTYRVFSAIARRTPHVTSSVRTNMGISSRLACDVPPTHFVARFGKPALYEGERGALELAARLSEHSGAFVDIGAHVGYFTLHVRSRIPPSTPIYFFEPDPALFAALHQNVAVNELPNVRGFNEAIGARRGTGTFYVNLTDSLSGSLVSDFNDRHSVRPIETAVRSFAEVAYELDLTGACVKVDVEGMEWEFMEGAAGAFDRIDYLIMEVLGPANRKKFVPELMARTGFRAYYINDYRLEPSGDGSFRYRPPEYNWLFCRERPAELSRKLGSSLLRVAQ